MTDAVEDEIKHLVESAEVPVIDCDAIARTLQAHYPKYSLEQLAQLVLAEVSRHKGMAAVAGQKRH